MSSQREATIRLVRDGDVVCEVEAGRDPRRILRIAADDIPAKYFAFAALRRSALAPEDSAAAAEWASGAVGTGDASVWTIPMEEAFAAGFLAFLGDASALAATTEEARVRLGADLDALPALVARERDAFGGRLDDRIRAVYAGLLAAVPWTSARSGASSTAPPYDEPGGTTIVKETRSVGGPSPGDVYDPTLLGFSAPLAGRTRGPRGVGGWLALFAAARLAIGPLLALGLSYFELAQLVALRDMQLGVLAAYPGVGYAVLFDVLARLAVTAYGAWAAWELWRTRPGAVASAKRSIVASIVFAFVELALPFLATLPPGLTNVLLLAGLAPSLLRVGVLAVWYGYFNRSERVANTYGRDAAHEAPVQGLGL